MRLSSVIPFFVPSERCGSSPYYATLAVPVLDTGLAAASW